MRFLLACYLLLAGEIVALADEKSAQAFLKSCPVDSTNTAGYCAGTLHAVMTLGPFLHPRIRFCPAGHSPLEALVIIHNFLLDHPNKQQEDAISLMVEAFEQQWPCKGDPFAE